MQRSTASRGGREDEQGAGSWPGDARVVWTTKADGRVEYPEHQVRCATMGVSDTEEINLAQSSTVHADDRGSLAERWARAENTVGTSAPSIACAILDGFYRWFLTRGVPLQDHDGRIVKWFGTSTEIDEIKRLERGRHALEVLARLRQKYWPKRTSR